MYCAANTRVVNVMFAALFAVSLVACNTVQSTHSGPDPRIQGARWDPPARYMGAYKGKLHVRHLPPVDVAPNEPNVLSECAKLGVTSSTGKPRGCARYSAGYKECWVVIIDRPYYGTTPEAVLVHELGHCNGWPENHPV